MAAPQTADFIIIGGGLSGCTIASLLSRALPDRSVIIIEAGNDASTDPRTQTGLGGLMLLGSSLDYAYPSTSQKQTANRVHSLHAGKVLGGGSTTNFCGWLRGDAADYDAWATVTGDSRWSYAGLLPYLRRIETYHGSAADTVAHGFDGPISVNTTTSSDSNRRYPLRNTVLKAWREIGITDAAENAGRISGIQEYCENTLHGKRQTSYQLYPLDRVRVYTDSAVHRIEFEGKRAARVRLVDGRLFEALCEVVLCAGAVGTPKVLMLSGIGPKDSLTTHNVDIVHENPDVGQNLHDHFALYMAYRLRHPDRGQALGSPALSDPAFRIGLPVDWIVNHTMPSDIAVADVSRDAFELSLQDPTRSHAETITLYAPGSVQGLKPDGAHIGTSTMILLPTSRGNVTITSESPEATPAINSNYYATEHDRKVLIYAVKTALRAMLSTEALKDIIAGEVPPKIHGEHFEPLTADASDSAIDDRIRRAGLQHHHSGGTAAMGRVVDGEGRVKGVTGLRVADASIIPVPLGGHPQASLYAVVEQIADLMAQAY